MRARVVPAALLALCACAAHADPRPLWELGAGAAVISFPDYRGSNEQRQYLLPLPYLVYRGEVLQVDRDKVRGLLFKRDRVELDVSVNGSVPIRSSHNAARSGMPDLDPTLELGPSLNLLLAAAPNRYALTLKLPVRAVIASDFRHVHGAGVLAQPVLNLDLRGRDDWKFGFVAGPLVGSRRYHDYFYTVAPEFATAERPAYEAPGGYSGAQFIAAASKRFARFWVGGFIKSDNVSGAAFAASPLTKRHNNVAGGFAVSWIFAQSGVRVEARD